MNITDLILREHFNSSVELLFHLFPFRCPVDRLPVYTADIRKDAAFNQQPKADWCISADICRKIKMLAAVCIRLDPIMVMAMNIQTPGKAIDRFMGEKDLLRYKQRSFINLIKDVLIVFPPVMIAQKKDFMPGLDLRSVIRTAKSPRQMKVSFLVTLLLIIQICSSGGIQSGSIRRQSSSSR